MPGRLAAWKRGEGKDEDDSPRRETSTGPVLQKEEGRSVPLWAAIVAITLIAVVYVTRPKPPELSLFKMNNSILESLDLLLANDLVQYAPIVKKKKLTISHFAKAEERRPLQGFTAEHWAILVKGARKRTATEGAAPEASPPSPADPPTMPAGTSNLPVVCQSLARSKALKTLWQTWSGSPEESSIGPGNECIGAPLIPPSLEERHLKEKEPLLAASREKRFVKQQLSERDVLILRKLGVSEQFYVDHDLKIAYCVVPKAGCTTYKGWMLETAGVRFRGTVHNRTLYRGPRLVMGQFMSDKELAGVLNSPEYFKFTVVRNPFTKALATYLERYERCVQKGRKVGECNAWRMALGGYKIPVSEEATFEDYLRIVLKVNDSVIDFRNAHYLPSTRICALNKIQYDWIGHLEEKTDTKLVFDFAGHHARARQKHTQRTSAKLKQYYTDSTRQLIKDIFGDNDLQYLGYSYPVLST